MSSSLSTVKKSVSVPHSFPDNRNCKKRISKDKIYYEEAWDLRMARLGIDIAELNSFFIENVSVEGENSDSGTMIRSCIEPTKRHDPPIIRMTSSAIEDSVIANNPVYSFKSFEDTAKSVTSSPVKNHLMHNPDLSNTMVYPRVESDQTIDECFDDAVTICPRLNRGLLLNNNCYELPSSQLVNAIIDKDREPNNSRFFSNANSSAFKPLFTTKSRPNQTTALFNNHCYTSVPASTLSTIPKTNVGYSRQISAPVDSATEMLKKMAYQEDSERTSKTLQFKVSRRSMKSIKQSNLSQPTNTWTVKSRLPVDQHLNESSRISNKLMSMSMSMTNDESKLSDNYIKHLTGQEIAGNFIKQSQRPECHIQRTDDRYHMGFNDSRLDMIADSNRPLEEHLWYHPFLSRVESEQLLAKYPEGSFLVRKSESNTNEYSLSIRYKQKWLHMKICKDLDGQFVLGQYSQPYPSIPIMIRHYSCSFLPVKGANLISLQQPVFRH